MITEEEIYDISKKFPPVFERGLGLSVTIVDPRVPFARAIESKVATQLNDQVAELEVEQHRLRLLASTHKAVIRGLENQLASANDCFNQAIDFAVQQEAEAGNFLEAWRQGDTSEWPEFKALAVETKERPVTPATTDDSVSSELGSDPEAQHAATAIAIYTAVTGKSEAEWCRESPAEWGLWNRAAVLLTPVSPPRTAQPTKPLHSSLEPFKCPVCKSSYFGPLWEGTDHVGRYCKGWPSGHDRSYIPCKGEYSVLFAYGAQTQKQKE